MVEAFDKQMEKYIFMKKLSFFHEMNSHALWPLAQISEEYKFEHNDHIINEGEESKGIFIITSGKVSVTKRKADGSEINIAELGEGEILGEMSVIDKKHATASVIASEPTTCLFISEWDFNSEMLAHPVIAFELMKVLVSRIRLLYDKMES